MEEQEQEILELDMYEVIEFIQKQTGLDGEVIEAVLVSETEYMKSIGIDVEIVDEESGQ